MDELDLPGEWRGALERFQQRPGVGLVLGATDSGKTTLCRWLVQSLPRAWMVDADPGQPSLGPPGLLWASDGAGYFIGSNSPRGHLLGCVLGTRLLVDHARASGALSVLVNSCGWIEDGAAVALHQACIDLVRPDLLLAFPRGLDPILEPLRHLARPETLRLPVSRSATRRSPEERARTRQQSYRRYFKGARETPLALSEVGLSGISPRALREKGQPGTAMGLFDAENRCLGMGLLVATRPELVVRLPARVEPALVKRLHLGRLRLGEDYKDV